MRSEFPEIRIRDEFEAFPSWCHFTNETKYLDTQHRFGFSYFVLDNYKLKQKNKFSNSVRWRRNSLCTVF